MTPDLPPTVEVHGWLAAGVALPLGTEATPLAGVDMARLQAVLDHGVYGSMLQIDAASETTKLLDAVVRLGRKETISLRAGRFKTPLSLDFGVPAPKMVLSSRALLVSAAPQRELGVELDLKGGPLALALGAYDPVTDLERTGPGVRPISALDWEPVRGLTVHTAATTWLRAEQAERELGTDAPRWDHQADLGVSWTRDGTTLATEGLVAHALPTDATEVGASAMAAHRLALGSTEIEPGIGWDSATLEDTLVHRASGALNLHLDDWYAVARLSEELTLATVDTDLQATTRLQVQVGF